MSEHAEPEAVCPPTWEYLVETRAQVQDLPGSPAEASYLATRGELGWELCGAPVQVPLVQPYSSGHVYYWKRKCVE